MKTFCNEVRNKFEFECERLIVKISSIWGRKTKQIFRKKDGKMRRAKNINKARAQDTEESSDCGLKNKMNIWTICSKKTF